jgi:tetratricopeptide (TPR) repeat protein
MPPKIKTNPGPGRAHWYDGWLIVLAAPLVICGCFNAPLIGLDDTVHVGHPLIAPGVPWYHAFKVLPDGGTYFPITLLSYRLDRWLYDGLFSASGNAPGYRLTSLLLHLASALVLWRILLCLKAGRWCSLFAAAAWAAHPAACESVAWVSERKNVLAAFFGFLALWAWIREWGLHKRLRIPLTMVLYALALLSKPTAAGFLAIFAAYEIIFPRSAGGENKPRRRWLPWASLLAMLLITAFLAWISCEAHKHVWTRRLAGTVFNTLLTNVEILRLYVFNMLLPLWLSFLYQVDPIISLADSRLWLSVIFLAGCVLISLRLVRERRLAVFLWCWFFGALLPALNIIPIWIQMQDRYVYFSLPALLLLLALSVAGAAQRLKIPSMPWFVIGSVAVFAGLAAARSRLYDSDIDLYRDAAAKQPEATYIHEVLGVRLMYDTERINWNATPDLQPQLQTWREEALQHLKTTFMDNTPHRIGYPRDEVELAVGMLNMRLGKAQLARKQLELARQTIESNKTLPQKHVSKVLLALAELDLNEGQPQKTLEDTQQAEAAFGMLSTEILYWRGQALERLGRPADALQAYSLIPSQDVVSPKALARVRALTNGRNQ